MINDDIHSYYVIPPSTAEKPPVPTSLHSGEHIFPIYHCFPVFNWFLILSCYFSRIICFLTLFWEVLRWHVLRTQINMCLLSFLWSFFNWSIIVSQRCVSFHCTTKWISYTYTYIPPSWTSSHLPHPSRSSQSTEPSSLCYRAGSHYFTHGVYTSILNSHFNPPSPSLFTCPFSTPVSLLMPYK